MTAFFLLFLLVCNIWEIVLGAAPTKVPTKRPTQVPSSKPTFAPSGPSKAPSFAPTSDPSFTAVPTIEPTASPSVGGEKQLFAVVGGTSCAENLYYGPQAITESGSEDGKYPYFLSTNTLSATVPHTNWLQIVTSDGSNELFRIYWSFRTAKTIGQRFIDAVTSGETVDYRIEVASTGQTLYKTATWRFSSAAAITTSKFEVASTTCCFSADDGAWGAGQGTVDANGQTYVAAKFWGVGNWDNSDNPVCHFVYRDGVDVSITNAKTFMYYIAPLPPSADPTSTPTAPSMAPTAKPTIRPTSTPTTKPTSTSPTTKPTVTPTAVPTRPTVAPTAVPSRSPSAEPTTLPTQPSVAPSAAPSVDGLQQLFAIVGGDACAAGLPYGPQTITEAGNFDGRYPYFFSTNTLSKNVPHTNWLQIVKSDDVELFRIYWTFRTAKTLGDRFYDASTVGEMVEYRVEDNTGLTYTYSANWRFSTYAYIGSKFSITYVATGFSSYYAAWGAGNGTVDGYGPSYQSNQFWGIANFNTLHNSECSKVYRQGVAYTNFASPKTFMYYYAPLPPTVQPTFRPSTLQPTAVTPTTAPSVTGTMGNVPDYYQLFAVLSGTNCAEDLVYGPSQIDSNGQVGGSYSAYLSTNTTYKALPHTEWLQIVTSDGFNELFRIYWTFATPRTLQDHFTTAVSVGESVSYRVVDNSNTEYLYSGTWRFSTSAGSLGTKFATTSSTTRFSMDDGAWGAGSGVVNGNGQTYAAVSFWGVGNFDTTDSIACGYVYKAGVRTYLSNQKTYVYYSAELKPTPAPTTAPTRFDYELFAVVGGDSCTENLYYGPASITASGSSDGHTYYLSTGTTSKNTLHTKWLQIVTDGNNELFRVYWSFSVARKLEDHFLFAVYYGESVSYRVVDSSGTEYTYSGTWRFSDAAGLTTAKFAATTTQYGFSLDDGAWGAGSTVINANGNEIGYTYINFWGIGNWNALDNTCSVVYMNGVAYSQYSSVKSYMYYAAITTPTALPTPLPGTPTFRPTTLPTAQPTRTPTRAPSFAPTRTPTTATPTRAPSCAPTRAPTTATPTRAPSFSPTKVPTTLPTTRVPSAIPSASPPPPVGANDVLFAVVGGSACAENLYYGPTAITTSGGVNGVYEYFLSTSTAYKDTLHTQWVQVVTSDGSTELFRVYWTFSVARKLSDHFISAVATGESVSYRIVGANGAEYTYSGTWRFSDGAANLAAKFATTSVTYGFSADDGVWGGGSGVINGNGNSVGYSSSRFWGIGNWDSGDYSCSTVYMEGVSYNYGTNTKVYMYYTAVPGPSAAPTTTPTNPTTRPTTAPTPLPTRRPTTNPTTKPTTRPTTTPTTTAMLNYVLFGVVGGTSCAEDLSYGPQAVTQSGSVDGLYQYYMSTTVGNKIHRDWMQVVTSDGSTELFRVYWSFSTAKTVAQRIADAVVYGEYTSYRVVLPSGAEYAYTGTWRFSDTAGFTVSKFSTPYTACCLSADDGAWGAGSGVINANGNPNGYMTNSFWGIGNWDDTDSPSCYRIYQNGVLTSSTNTNTKVYMYFNDVPVVTSAPVPYPTLQPVQPSRRPSPAPTVYVAPELFAVVGGTSCAETLYYGPQYISTVGSGDGQYPYFLSTSTYSKNVAHQYWLQVVTSDGFNELFRIYWTFSVARTLANHFYYASMYGESVTYTVVTPAGQTYTYAATWRFSSAAQISLSKFTTTFTTTPLSADSGAWGAGRSNVDGYSGVPSNFWGIGNFRGFDGFECYKVYQNGVSSAEYGTGVKVFMYSSAVSIAPAPTMMPTTQPPMITLQATQQVDGVSFDAYSANTLAFNTVFKATIAATVTGISVNDITYMAALPVNRRRSLAEEVSGVVSGVVDSVVDSDVGSAGADEGQEERHIDPSTITTPTTAITAPTTSNLRAGAKQTITSSSINLDYTISVPAGSGATYDTMSSQLKDSVNSNQFTTRLQQFAAEQNVTELNGASSSSIETQNTTPNSDSSKSGSTFTLPMIVGIAVGGCALFVFVIYSWFWCFSRRAPQPGGGGPFPRLDTLQNQASAPPMANDPSLSKDINAYFYGDSTHSTSASHRGNQIVTTDHDAAELGGVGVGPGANEGYTHTVDSPHSSHRPHPAVSPYFSEGGGGSGSDSRGSGIEMHDMSQHSASPASKSVSAPHTPVSARESLPVAAMAVTVDHSHIALSQDHEIAIAEVYLGEAEEYKE